MPSPFDVLVDDIFNSPDFLEECRIDGVRLACISSPCVAVPEYTEYGLDLGVSFHLKIRNDRRRPLPKRGMPVFFRGESYKVASATLDSAGLSYDVYLKSESSV